MTKSPNILSNVAHLKGGYAFKSSDYTPSGRFILRTVNITDDGRIDRTGATFISEKDADEYSNFELEDGDTLFVMVGATLGKVGLVTANDLPALLNQNMWVIRAKDPDVTCKRYLNYWFKDTVKRTIQWASGSARGFVTRDDYRSLPFPSIKIETQRQIAQVLVALDAKIEINQRMNVELERMAKLLYDYWFVQFDFPMTATQATALGKPHLTGHPYRASGGLMTYNEILKREIPKGWDVGNIFSVSDVGGGATPSKKAPEFWGGEVPFFTPTDARSEPFCMDTEDHLSRLGMKNKATRLYPKGTVFITARGSVGKTMIISKEMAMNQSCYALSPHPGIGSAFLYFHTLSLMDYLRLKSSGSVFDSIVTNDLSLTPAIVPSPEAIIAFGQIVEPMFESILLNQTQTQELTALRDWLLPMLMNGQVTVN